MYRRRLTALIWCAAVLTTLSGCARFPSTPPTTGKEIVLTLRVQGRISPIDQLDPSLNRHYFIAIDNDNDVNTGPWAVAFPPYGGNGWVTSRDATRSIGVTHFIEYDAANPSGYLYGFVPNSNFLLTTAPQPPVRYEILDGGSTLRFTIDISQLATASVPVDQIRYLDINFITTNQLAVNPNELYPNRQFDGLGPTGQDYVTVDTTLDRLYSGTDEDASPVTDPDMDITYWSIQVQTFSSR